MLLAQHIKKIPWVAMVLLLVAFLVWAPAHAQSTGNQSNTGQQTNSYQQNNEQLYNSFQLGNQTLLSGQQNAIKNLGSATSDNNSGSQNDSTSQDQTTAPSDPMGNSTGGALAGTPVTKPIPTDQATSDDLGCMNGISICITSLVYFIGPGIAAQATFLSAYFFDTFVRIALTSSTYALDILSKGWAIMRSIANIAFLFILIYIAIVIMLEAETANTTRMLASFVIMALLVNFSFFLTRVVIDGGNILATQFYNATANSMPSELNNASTSWLGAGTTDLTAPIMNVVGIQKLTSNDAFKKWYQNNSFLTVVITLSFLYICVAILYWILFFIFLTAGIKFLSRVVMLWYTIIAAPIAFAAHVLTNNQFANKIYKGWQNNLVQWTLYPAVFMFMYYLLITIIYGIACQTGTACTGGLVGDVFNVSNLTNTSGGAINYVNTSLYVLIGSIAIKMGIIIALMYYGMKAADKIAEEGNSFAQKMASRVTGFAAGAAGWTGRRTIGTAAHQFANSETGKNIGNKGVLGRTLWRGADALSGSSFDVRNSKIADKSAFALGRSMGVDAGKGSKANYRSSVATWNKRNAAATAQLNQNQQTQQQGTTNQQTPNANTQGTAQQAPSFAATAAAIRNLTQNMQASGPTSPVGTSPAGIIIPTQAGGGPRSEAQQQTMQREREEALKPETPEQEFERAWQQEPVPGPIAAQAMFGRLNPNEQQSTRGSGAAMPQASASQVSIPQPAPQTSASTEPLEVKNIPETSQQPHTDASESSVNIEEVATIAAETAAHTAVDAVAGEVSAVGKEQVEATRRVGDTIEQGNEAAHRQAEELNRGVRHVVEELRHRENGHEVRTGPLAGDEIVHDMKKGAAEMHTATEEISSQSLTDIPATNDATFKKPWFRSFFGGKKDE